MTGSKLVCTECWAVTTEPLTAPNPFDPEDAINGCPSCHGVETLAMACDEPGCEQVTTCGMDTPNGYRATCSRHWPGRQQ